MPGADSEDDDDRLPDLDTEEGTAWELAWELCEGAEFPRTRFDPTGKLFLFNNRKPSILMPGVTSNNN